MPPPTISFATLLLGACLLSINCGSTHATVEELKNATVPAGNSVPVLGSSITEAQSLVFSWEFDTHLAPSAYMDWVASRLTAKRCTIQRREPTSIHATRVEQGDSYQLLLEVSGPPTHVRATLRAASF